MEKARAAATNSPAEQPQASELNFENSEGRPQAADPLKHTISAILVTLLSGSCAGFIILERVPLKRQIHSLFV